jgi:hypothetical protein
LPCCFCVLSTQPPPNARPNSLYSANSWVPGGGISAEEVGWKRLGIAQGQTMILSLKNDLNMENTVVDLTE